jgi:hypothetical protein
VTRPPRRSRWLVVLALAVGCSAGAAVADEPAPSTWLESVGLDGSLRGAYWSSSRDLDGREHMPVAALWLRGRWDPDPAAALRLDGWVRNDDLFHARDTSGRLREGYLDLRAGPLDLRLGRQIIAWGRADRINPTDTLTPRDFTLLVPEDGDQRFGVTGARATLRVAGLSLIGVVLPTFEPHVIPLRRPPPGSTLRQREPDDPVLQGAFKIERTGGRLDWSASYFDGYDLFPDVGIDGVRPGGVDVVLTHHRVRVVGVDAAAAVGPHTVRGEAAYTFTERSGARDPIKSSFFFLVLGADRTFPHDLYVNLQYVLRVVSDFRRPASVPDPIGRQAALEQALINDQLDRVKHAVAVRLATSWLNDTLRAEIGAIVSVTRGDYALRPKIAYAVTDRLKLTAGGDLLRGPTPSFFDRLRDTSTAYVEVRWDF